MTIIVDTSAIGDIEPGPIDSLPAAPQPTDGTSSFKAKAFTFVAALPTFISQVNAAIATMLGYVDNALSAQNAAQSYASTASTGASTATAASQAALATANASLWISGATYGQATNAISPLDLRTYRRNSAGAGTTDPSLDGVNWTAVIAQADRKYASTTANLTVHASHKGYLVEITSGSPTLSLDAVATLGVGWHVTLLNSGYGFPVIDPNASEQIDGATTRVLRPGESITVSVNDTATAFRSTGGYTKGRLCQVAATTTASASATVDLAGIFSANFDVYKIVLTKVRPSATANLILRTSSNAGVSYDSTAGNYAWGKTVQDTGASTSSTGSASDSGLRILDSAASTATASVNGEITVYKPTDGSSYPVLEFRLGAFTATQTLVTGSGSRLSAAAIDSLRFLFSTGNVAAGDFTVYGLCK